MSRSDLTNPGRGGCATTTLVLVHGAFGSPAALTPVTPELEALGHRAPAVDLP